MIKKPFKILSIDGGGIKGVFQTKLLADLEDHFGVATSACFDMICGTSTGGIIALALGSGLSARDVHQFYREHGPHIFPHEGRLAFNIAFFKQVVFGAKYSPKPLENALRGIIGDKKMMDSQNALIIPAFCVTKGGPTVFKAPLYKRGDDGNPINIWNRDASCDMADVALATAAAPTYFPIHGFNDQLYIDGGVWANNPVLCGLTEALHYYVNSVFEADGHEILYDEVQILSISSLNQPVNWSSKNKRDRSVISWLKGERLIPPFMEGNAYFNNRFMEHAQHFIKAPLLYKRITPSFALSPEKLKNIGLDKAYPSAINDMIGIAADTASYYRSTKRHEVEPFFRTPKSFHPSHMNIGTNGKL